MIGPAALFLAAATPSTSDQKILDLISVSCGRAADEISISEGKLVSIHPKASPCYGAVICALPKLKKSGFIYPVGIISNPPADHTN